MTQVRQQKTKKSFHKHISFYYHSIKDFVELTAVVKVVDMHTYNDNYYYVSSVGILFQKNDQILQRSKKE